MILGMRQSLASSPVVQALFAAASNDYTTLSTTSSMPSGGLITRAGNAMVYDSTGKLTWAPNNIAISSNTYNANWTLAGISSITTGVSDPVGGTAASSLVEDGTTGLHRIYSGASSGFTAVSGVSYLVSLDIKPVTRTWTRIFLGGAPINGGSGVYAYFNLSGAGSVGTATATSPGVTQLASGWYRVYFKVTAGSAGLTALYIEGATADTVNSYAGSSGSAALSVYNFVSAAVTYETTPRSADQVITTTSAYYGPRFDYNPATLAAKGLLVEGSRTNSLVNSNSFAASWNVINATVSANSTTSPDGTNNATLVTASATNGSLYQQFVGSTATLYQGSIWIKRASGTGTIKLIDAAGGRQTVTVTANWARYTAALTSVSSTPFFGIEIATSGDAVYIYGAQSEAGSFPTSYIPTTTAAVTRAAETFTLANYQNRLVESFYIDEQTGGSWSANINASATSPLTISTPTFGWVTSLRPYTNAYAGDITTPSWIDNSGTTGNRMYYDSTGALTWAPANLTTNSQNFSGAIWNASNFTRTTGQADPLGGNNATLGTFTSNGGSGLYANAFAIPGDKSHIISIYAKYGTWRWFEFTTVFGSATRSWVDMENGVAGATTNHSNFSVTPVGGGWYRISAKVTGATEFYWSARDGNANAGAPTTHNGATFYVFGVQAEAVTYQTSPRAYIPTTSAAVYQPRYDYDPSVTPATPRGMLIEESRVNSLTYSEQFDNVAWSKYQLTTSGTPAWVNVAISPDGTTTADKLIDTTVNDTHITFRSAVLTAASYTFTVYAKAAERSLLYLRLDNTTAKYAYFNLSTGATSNVNAAYAATMTSVGNGWYRCSVTTTASAATYDIVCGMAITSGTPSYAGDGISGLFVWGAQLEAGSFPTSYIPTTTASVTRVADVVKWTSAAFSSYWSASAGTIIGEYFKNTGTGAGTVVRVGDGTGNNRIDVFYRTTSMNMVEVITSGATVARYDFTVTLGAIAREANAFAANNFNAAYNGTAYTADTSGAVPTVTTFYIGSANDGAWLNGWLRSLAYYNQRLSDATLAQKSTVGASY